MRFSWSTHPLMSSSLEALTFIIRTGYSNGLTILVELINLMNSVIIFLSQTNLLRCLTFLLGSLTFDSHSPALLDLFLSSDASICSTMAFPPLKKSVHAFVSVSIDFSLNSKWDAPFRCIAYMTIPVLVGTVFMIIWEMFHSRVTWCFCCC